MLFCQRSDFRQTERYSFELAPIAAEILLPHPETSGSRQKIGAESGTEASEILQKFMLQNIKKTPPKSVILQNGSTFSRTNQTTIT